MAAYRTVYGVLFKFCIVAVCKVVLRLNKYDFQLQQHTGIVNAFVAVACNNHGVTLVAHSKNCGKYTAARTVNTYERTLAFVYAFEFVLGVFYHSAWGMQIVKSVNFGYVYLATQNAKLVVSFVPRHMKRICVNVF